MASLAYPSVTNQKCKVITFGVADVDISVMRKYVHKCDKVTLTEGKRNIVYAGRGGHDLDFALNIIFKAFAEGLAANHEEFSQLHFWFIGTSYAPAGMGKKTIQPIAAKNNVEGHVTEITDRIPYFQTLFLLDKADILLIPGSTDSSYTASKIFPYIILEKKLLAVFHQRSSVISLLQELNYGEIVAFDSTSKSPEEYVEECFKSLNRLLSPDYNNALKKHLFEPQKAFSKTKQQVDFFNEILDKEINVNA